MLCCSWQHVLQILHFFLSSRSRPHWNIVKDLIPETSPISENEKEHYICGPNISFQEGQRRVKMSKSSYQKSQKERKCVFHTP